MVKVALTGRLSNGYIRHLHRDCSLRRYGREAAGQLGLRREKPSPWNAVSSVKIEVAGF